MPPPGCISLAFRHRRTGVNRFGVDRRSESRWASCHRRPFPSSRAPTRPSFITVSLLTSRLGPLPRGNDRSLDRTLRFTSRDCSAIAGGPTFNASSRPIALGFRGSQSPRTADHFVFVSSVELDGQTTSPSRAAPLSGAYPDFPFPNPLSGMVLIVMLSAHFQDFQALRALAGSYLPNALTGTYTLLLSARRSACRRDPAHAPLSCQTPLPVPSRHRVQPCRLRQRPSSASRCPACLRVGFSSCIWAVSRAPGSTPTAGFNVDDVIPHSTKRELALDDESNGHRLTAPHRGRDVRVRIARVPWLLFLSCEVGVGDYSGP